MKGGYEYVHESSDWQTKITNDVSYNTDVYRIVGMGVPAAAQTKEIICDDYGRNYSIEFNSEYKKSTTEVVIKNATSGKMSWILL